MAAAEPRRGYRFSPPKADARYDRRQRLRSTTAPPAGRAPGDKHLSNDVGSQTAITHDISSQFDLLGNLGRKMSCRRRLSMSEMMNGKTSKRHCIGMAGRSVGEFEVVASQQVQIVPGPAGYAVPTPSKYTNSPVGKGQPGAPDDMAWPSRRPSTRGPDRGRWRTQHPAARSTSTVADLQQSSLGVSSE
jgi:hypothetical protein